MRARLGRSRLQCLMMAIQAIVFDGDGVIFEGELFSNRLARDHQIPLDLVNPFFKKEFKECLVGKADLKIEIVKYFPQWRWKGSVEDLLDYWFDGYQLNSRLLDYIADLRQKGVKCYLASNQEKYRRDYLMRECHFADYFDQVFFSCDLGLRKPETSFFEHLIEKIKLPKEQILFWDDDQKNLVAAQEFGFQVEKYDSLEDLQQKLERY